MGERNDFSGLNREDRNAFRASLREEMRNGETAYERESAARTLSQIGSTDEQMEEPAARTREVPIEERTRRTISFPVG